MSSPPDRPLTDRIALVTGVSRSIGIGARIAQRLHDAGATVDATGWPPHDAEMPWGASPLGPLPFDVERDDLAGPDTPTALIDRTVERHGAIDIVVATHARSSDHDLAGTEPDELDRCWAVNVRSVVMLAKRLAAVHRPAPVGAPPRGRLIWFTSGQHHGPMHGELPYAITKGALHSMTATIAAAVDPARVVANCINPGPVDTGYADARSIASAAERFPDRRWGTPHDIADVVEFLVGDRGAWIRGQVIDVDGGFRHTG